MRGQLTHTIDAMKGETMEHLPVYVCAHCRKPGGGRLVNLTQRARRRYGLVHQAVHVECRLEIHRQRKAAAAAKGEERVWPL